MIRTATYTSLGKINNQAMEDRFALQKRNLFSFTVTPGAGRTIKDYAPQEKPDAAIGILLMLKAAVTAANGLEVYLDTPLGDIPENFASDYDAVSWQPINSAPPSAITAGLIYSYVFAPVVAANTATHQVCQTYLPRIWRPRIELLATSPASLDIELHAQYLY